MEEASSLHEAGEQYLSDSHKVLLVTRALFRREFGTEEVKKQGHFVDQGMSSLVHQFWDWIPYPSDNHELFGHLQQIFCSVICSEGKRLFTGSMDASIIEWDLLDYSMASKSIPDSYWVRCLDFCSGMLVSGHPNGSIHLIDASLPRSIHRVIRTFHGHQEQVLTVSFSKDAQMLISGANDRTLRLWSVKEGTSLRVFRGHRLNVMSAMMIDDHLIVSSGYDGSVKLWNRDDGLCIRTVTDSIPGCIYTSVLNLNHSALACLCRGMITVFEWPSLTVISQIEKRTTACQFHPIKLEWLALYVIHPSKGVEIVNVMNGEVVWRFGASASQVRSLSFTPDGRRLVSVSVDKIVRLWDLDDLDF